MPSGNKSEHSGTGPMVGEEHTGERSGSLCMTCQHLVSCVHRKDHPEPVMFCELFEEGSWSGDHLATIIGKHAEQRGGIIAILEAIPTTVP